MSVEVALREERIAELEKERRELHEQIDTLKTENMAQTDQVRELRKQVGRELDDYIGPRDARILELERENNALRKLEAAAQKWGRDKQDQYDALCTKIGQEKK